jgi:hypothetical protein
MKGIALMLLTPAVEAVLRKSGVVLALFLAWAPVRANDVDPFGFEKEHFQTSKTRAEVTAELRSAQARGELPVFGEIGVVPVPAGSVKTRAQVRAETIEAARLGLIGYGELGAKQATPEQERQIELAGMRALAPPTAAMPAGRGNGG